MKPLQFSVKFHKRSTHWVNVVIYKTRTQMRRKLKSIGHDSSQTNAACWQANQPGKDHCVAEIHLAKDFLTLSTIAHESSHAAHHRAVLIGVPFDDESFQEYVAEDTGHVADAIVAFCDSKRIPIRYDTVPTRRMI